jgi:hypothetical protein
MSRGSTTPSLFVAQDGREWVVKPCGRTFRDGLVEVISSRLAVQFGIATPPTDLFDVSEGLLAAMGAVDDDLRALAQAFERGGRMAFGSLLCPGVDWVSGQHLAGGEREKLGNMWIFDQWIANADRRPDNPNLILSDRRLLAIDHAQGLPWLNAEAPRPAPHVRDALGIDPEVLRAEAAGRAALLPFADAGRVRRAMGEVPAAWAHPDELDTLADVLAARARTLALEPIG